MKNSVESNIWKLYWIKGLKWFMLIVPILVLFMQENGLNLTQVVLLEAIFSIIVVALEVPSGYFADVYGRKTSIVLGTVFGFAGFIVYALSFDFVGFLVAEASLGIAASFISGADSALLYDTLLQVRKEENYKKEEGKIIGIGMFSESIASIIGGLLAVVSLRTPFYAQVFVSALTIPLALSLIEPIKHKNISGKYLKELIDTIKYALHDNTKLKWIIVFYSTISASTMTVVWFIQPYWQLLGVPIILFGVAWALLQVSSGVVSVYSHKIEEKLGRKNTLLTLVLLPAIAYLLIGLFQAIWAAAFLLLFYFVRGVNAPVIKDCVNKLIPSHRRATILSINEMGFRLVFSITGPLIGFAADAYSLQTAFLISGALFLVLSGTSLALLHKNKAI